MADREKVIEHLKEIAEYFRECRSNASFASKAENHFWELQNAASEAADALSLLKAQEPIKPKVNIDTWVCGNCGTRVEHQSMIGPNAVLAETFKFCPECGKPVKWE